MTRRLGLLALILVAAACATTRGATRDPAVAWRLPAVARALGVPGPDASALRYAVRSHDGAWRYEIVAAPGYFAERRTRSDGRTYAFGEDAAGTWLRVGGGPARPAEGPWAREVRARAALFQKRFLRPGAGDEAVFVGRGGGSWELAFRAVGARTLTFAIDEASGRPTAWDYSDELGRLVVCEDVRWVRSVGGSVPEAFDCATTNGGAFRTVTSSVRLERAEALAAGAVPPWARPARAAPPEPVDLVELPITDERRILVDATTPGSAPAPLVLDSGAFHTVLSGSVARALGVVPTGEVPYHLEPPWLPAATMWIGVIDRLDVAGVAIDGARVLVHERLPMAGLLGLDFFRRFVVDVDTPGRVLRLVAHRRFRPGRGAAVTYLQGAPEAARIHGDIPEIGGGLITLDTGAPDTLIVHARAMASAHPRRRGDEVWLGEPRDDGATSPDYASTVRGVRLGGFRFPALRVVGRDRQHARVGSGIALAGMGLMRHLRLAFDLRSRVLWAWPGDGYTTLRRAGLEIDDGRSGPEVSWVAPGGSAAAAGIEEGDPVHAVAGRSVASAREARGALATHPGSTATITVGTVDALRSPTIALEDDPSGR